MKKALIRIMVMVTVVLFTICTGTPVQETNEPSGTIEDQIKNQVKVVKTTQISGKELYYLILAKKGGETLKLKKNGQGFVVAIEVYDEDGNLIDTVPEEDIIDILRKQKDEQ